VPPLCIILSVAHQSSVLFSVLILGLLKSGSLLGVFLGHFVLELPLELHLAIFFRHKAPLLGGLDFMPHFFSNVIEFILRIILNLLHLDAFVPLEFV